MRRNLQTIAITLFGGCLIAPILVVAQVPDAAEDPLDAVRRLDAGQDTQAISEWLRQQVTELEQSRKPDRFAAFRAALKDQRTNAVNTTAFVRALASATAAVATEVFGRADGDPIVAHAMARALRDTGRIERVPGLVAGLSSDIMHVRLLCAAGLADDVNAISSDKDRRETVIAAVRTAALKETQPIILEDLYRALAYPAQLQEVMVIYLEILDQRLEARRTKPGVVDCAEVELLEFFRRTATQLSDAQKKELVARLAVLLRLDMERYVKRFVGLRMDYFEMDCIERRLDSAEAILVALTGQPALIAESALFGKTVSKDAPAPEHKQTLLAHLATWIGDAAGNTPGLLNDPPWGVPIGAP